MRMHDQAELRLRRRIAGRPLRIMLLCFVVAMLDGFDTQVIGFVAPVIAREWRVDPAALGPVFAAGLVGVMIGAMVLGPLGDRRGRRPVIIASTALFGVFALATAFAAGPRELLLLRLLTGIGLGGAMPNLIALTDEVAPKRQRATAVAIMFAGIPAGAALGALGARWLIGDLGWRAVFVAGGALPIAVALLLVALLPESPRLLAARADPQSVAPHGRASIRALFQARRAGTTALVWLAVFANLLMMYVIVSWLPTLLTRSGLSVEAAVRAAVILNLGGLAGGLAIGRCIDRLGPFATMAGFYAGASLAVACAGLAPGSPFLFLVAIFGAGMGGIGGQLGMNALVASLYPTAIRSTAIGWSLAVGRLGSILGPLVAGLLLQSGWSSGAILLAFSLAGLVAAAAVIALARAAAAADPI